jgi:hypothetical protein
MSNQAITDFLARVDKMATSRSKEMRLTYEEANGLSVAIAQILVKRVDEKLVNEEGGIVISGGALKPTQ